MSYKFPLGYLSGNLIGQFVLPAISVASLISNALIVYIFFRKCKISCTTVLLSWISITDGLQGIVAGITYGSLYNLYPDQYIPYPVCKIVFVSFFMTIFHLASVFLNLFLAGQRFCVIQFPFRGPLFCTMKITIVAIAIAYVVGIAAYMPFLFVFVMTINPLMEPFKNTEITNNTFSVDFQSNSLLSVPITNISFHPCTCVVELTRSSAEDLKFAFDYSQIIDAVVVFTGVVILIVTTTGITINLWITRMSVAGYMKNREIIAAKRRTTIMVIAIVIIFLLSEIPSAIQMMCLMKGFKGPVCSLLETYKDTPYLIYVISIQTGSLLNIWIYLLMCKEFRMGFLNLIPCRSHCVRKETVKNTSTPVVSERNTK